MTDSLQDRILARTPVAYWKLDETTGSTAIDATGNGHDATHTSVAVGADPLAYSENGSKAATYDGSNSLTTLPASITAAINGAPAVSLAFELEFPAFPSSSYKGVFSLLVNGTFAAAYVAPQSDGTVLVGGRSQAGDGFQSVTVPAGKVVAGRTQHIVAVFNYAADAIRVYVDGALAVEGTGKSFGSSTLVMGSPNAHTLGSGTSDKFACTVDDAAIFDYALTDADAYSLAARVVQQDFTATVNQLLPYFHYPLNETSGSTAADASGNGRDGTYGSAVVLGQTKLRPTGTVAADFVDDAANSKVTGPQLTDISQPWTFNAFVEVDGYVTGDTGRLIANTGSGNTGGMGVLLGGASRPTEIGIYNDATTSAHWVDIGRNVVGDPFMLSILYDGSGADFLIDGVYVGTASTSLTDRAVAAVIGNRPEADKPLDGRMSDVAWWGRELTRAQAEALHWRATTVSSVEYLADRILARNPVGYWKLDETSGTNAADSSGNGHDATHTDVTVGIAPLAWSEPTSKGADYDGSTSYTHIANTLTPALSGASAISATATVKMRSFPPIRRSLIYIMVSGSDYGFYVGVDNNGTVDVDARASAGSTIRRARTPTGTIKLNRVHQWTAVADFAGGRVAFYLDGKLIVEVTGQSFTGNFTPSSPGTATFGSHGTSFLDIEIDDVAVFDTALTAADAHALAARVVQRTYLETAAALGAVAAFGFDETSGTTVADSSASGLTGTASGGATLNAEPLMLGGRALNFDGSTGDVALGSPSALQQGGAMSFAAFVKPDSVASAQPLYTYVKGSGPFNGVAFSLAAGGNVRMFINNNSFSGSEGVNSTGTVAAGQTAFVGAARAADGSVQFTIDGADAGTGTLSETPDFTGLNAYLGFDPAGVRYAGDLDGFLVFPYALTLAQFEALNWRATTANESVVYVVSGTVRQGNQPAARTVRLYDQTTGALIAETTSDGTTGEYSFELETADPVFVFGVPADGYVPLSRGPVVPAEQ